MKNPEHSRRRATLMKEIPRQLAIIRVTDNGGVASLCWRSTRAHMPGSASIVPIHRFCLYSCYRTFAGHLSK